MAPLRSDPTFPVLGCHAFCGKWGGMQEQKSRQPAGGKSSFSPNALCEMSSGPGNPLGSKTWRVKQLSLILKTYRFDVAEPADKVLLNRQKVAGSAMKAF